MEKLNLKYNTVCKALQTLQKVLLHVDALEKGHTHLCIDVDYGEEYSMRRDSAIQRFEYTIDLLWKYLKAYLEVKNISSQVTIPGEVIRMACSYSLVTQDEAEVVLRMIKSRNRTSHMYHEELAIELIKDLQVYTQWLVK